jgi:hypothetical protein
MIETLCLDSLFDDKAQEATLKCIDDYFDCLKKNGGVKTENIEKAKTWAFLSAHGSFDPQIGRAAQKKIWNWDGQTFQPLINFSKALSSDEYLLKIRLTKTVNLIETTIDFSYKKNQLLNTKTKDLKCLMF